MSKEEIEKVEEEEINLRSEEVQEIMGRVPPAIERYGIAVIACITLFLIVGSFFFRYPDAIDAPIVITNSTPPVNIISKTNGKIVEILKQNEDSVHVGELLGVIESDADYKDVLALEDMVNQFLAEKITDNQMVQWMSGRELILGGMQNEYLSFKTSLTDKIRVKEEKYLPQKIEVAKERIDSRAKLESKEKNLHVINIEQEAIAYEIFKRDSLLHSNKMISDEEYERASLTFYQSKQGPVNRDVADEQFRMQRINEKENLLDLEHQYDESVNTHEQNCNSALRQLRASIVKWEQIYILRSPIDGVLNYTSVWNKNQTVNAGEAIFIIVPDKMMKPIGKALVPPTGMGRIKVGQKVIVKVNNFPDEDFGNLVGKVAFISKIPTSDGVYMVDVDFPEGLVTIFHRRLPETLQLSGTSQIVVENRRLADLFIQPVRRLMKSQETLNTAE